MAKLTDKERKMILAELTMGSSIRACASKYHTSVGTVQRIKHESSDEIRQQIEKERRKHKRRSRLYGDAKRLCLQPDCYAVGRAQRP